MPAYRATHWKYVRLVADPKAAPLRFPVTTGTLSFATASGAGCGAAAEAFRGSCHEAFRASDGPPRAAKATDGIDCGLQLRSRAQPRERHRIEIGPDVAISTKSANSCSRAAGRSDGRSAGRSGGPVGQAVGRGVVSGCRATVRPAGRPVGRKSGGRAGEAVARSAGQSTGRSAGRAARRPGARELGGSVGLVCRAPPKFARTPSKFGLAPTSVGRFGQHLPEVGRLGPALTGFGVDHVEPISTEAGWDQPTLGKPRPDLADFNNMCAGFAQS